MVLHTSVDAPITCEYWDELVDEDGFLALGRNRYHCTYVCHTDGTYYYAENGRTGELDYGGPNNRGGVSGTDGDGVVQAAINNLTGGRVGKETVLIKGDWEFSAAVEVPSYTRIQINGSVKAGANVAAFTDDNTVDTVHVEFNRGTIYGDDGTVESGQRGIYMRRVTDFTCFDVVFHDLDDGLNISYGARAKLIALEVYSCYNGIVLNEAGDHTNKLTDVELIGVHVHDTTNDGIQARPGANGFSTDSVRVVNIGGYGLWMRDIFSGAWINNFVADVCGADGIYVGPGCESIEMSNIWARSCGEHGIYLHGTGAVGAEFADILGVLIQGAVLQNNQETGLKIVNAHQVQCENLKAIDNALAYAVAAADDNATNILIQDDAQVVIKGGRAGWQHTYPLNRLMAIRVAMGAGSSDDTVVFLEGITLMDDDTPANAHVQYKNNQVVYDQNIHTKDMCIGDTTPATTVCIVDAPSPGTTNIWERDMTKDAHFNDS